MRNTALPKYREHFNEPKDYNVETYLLHKLLFYREFVYLEEGNKSYYSI